MNDSDASVSSRQPWMWIAAALGVLAAILASAAIVFYRDSQSPANDSADVGFARDMSIHHAQAVDMSNIVYRRTDDPDIARLALDIATTQQFQIGMMTGWLDIWGRSVSSDLPLMAWMGDWDMTLPPPPPGLDAAGGMAGMDHSATPAAGDVAAETPLMPGMATSAQIAELETLPPDEMDQQFLRLMIRHHQGGVMMAEAALALAKDDHVRTLAQRVVDSQSAEIETMTQMLNERAADATTPSSEATPAAAGG